MFGNINKTNKVTIAGLSTMIFACVIVASVLVMPGCTGKKLELEVEQEGCDKFKIDAASYDILADPCDSVNTNLLLDLSFNYNGDTSCLHEIELTAELFDVSNQVMSGVDYPSVIDKSQIFINNGTATFTLDIKFSSVEQAQSFNYAVITFNTQNELDQESPKAKVRVITSCMVVTEDMYNMNTDTVVTVSPTDANFEIRLWDHAAQDGDRVSVYLNGTWVIENHSLLNDGTSFLISTSYLNQGSNDLVLFALNQGTSGPNTVSMSINGADFNSINPDLETGEGFQIDF